MLKIRRNDVKSFLASPLYCKVLALKQAGAEETLAALKESAFPVITRKSDALALKKGAQDCFLTAVRANDLYNVRSNKHPNEYATPFV